MLKILPQLLLILGLVLFFTGVPPHLEELKASEQEVRNLMPLLVTVLSLLVTLGGFAFKQYTSYKNKHIKFQKNVTETLFFRNLASNAGVFSALIDAAEEEECKEIILVYYHLLTSNYSLTPEQLDDQVEVWMNNKFGTKIDFDIYGPLRNLEAISTRIVKNEEQEASTPEITLLTYDSQGNCCVLPLDDALKVLDYIWDKAFLYT